ncbi:MAG: hypothetical protein GX666_03505 [Tissierellia bacterium]|nr:hypothetical protein [Tissierellia bacterium]
MNLTVKEAAKILGKSTDFVKMGIETGILPIGVCVEMGRKNYHISREALETYMKYGARPLIIDKEFEDL